jgi:glycosyltransferase involved in cell wall biosynthesis
MFTLVIPVYNASKTLEALSAELEGHLDQLAEVIFVDDGSVDGSWSIVTSIVDRHEGWRGIRLGRNAGQHRALLAGLRAATNPIVVTMDDDLQHRPSEIATLTSRLANDIDLVYGTARVEEHGAVRSLSSRLIKKVLRSSIGVPYAEYISAFRAFRTDLRDAFSDVNDPYVSLDVLLSWATDRVDHVDVHMDQRAVGVSNYTLRRLIKHSFDMITGYSAGPLRLVAYLGSVFAGFGFAALAYVLVRFAVGGSSVAGFTFLAAMLSLASGVQMLAVAIIGEYLGRIHFRAMKRPAYHVAQVIGNSE